MKQIEFTLDLKASHIEHRLRAMETHRFWFPPANILFEISSGGKHYSTYIDNSSRLKLDYLFEDYDVRPGHQLRFRKVGAGTVWDVAITSGETVTQPLERFHKKPRRAKYRESIELSANEVYDLLRELSAYYDMIPEDETVSGEYNYAMTWKRVPSGNPVWVFEALQEAGMTQSLAKLKHARDGWNADIVVIVFSLQSLERVSSLLSDAFHEIRRRVLKILSWDLVGLVESKRKYSFVDDALSR
jgi:hypothetical protein